MSNELIKLTGISKAFSNVTVLHDINLTIEAGKVYSLAGENGAGKSTLCNIISGALPPTSGTITTSRGTSAGLSLEEAKALGIRMVHQELQILQDMSIAENIFCGSEVHKLGWVRYGDMFRQASALLETVGLDIDPRTQVRHVDIAARQLIEIARAISAEAKLIILDEPTSSLSEKEVKKLFSIVRENRAKGCSFLFISHRIEELLQISDEIIILKDGGHVATLDAAATDETEIIRNMVGRSYDDFYHRERVYFGGEALRIENLSGDSSKKKFSNAYTPQDISFHLEEGEVLGIAGLVGAGRTEIIKCLFGIDARKPGCKITVHGKPVEIRTPRQALRHGIAWITEDRKTQGIILDFSILSNIALPNLDKVTGKLFVSRKKEQVLAAEYIEKLRIKTTGSAQKLKSLSGGNQQKVVISKWLARSPKIFIMDEPTRGIDVGAKTEIYKLINQLTAEGNAVLLISSELPEIMGMSDRMLIMYEGRIAGQLSREDFTEETIMTYATGRKKRV